MLSRDQDKRSALRPGDLALSLVIPVYNEESSIQTLFDKIHEALDERFRHAYEIIFVEDGSNDQSYEMLQALAETSPEVIVVKFHRNFGQTAALSAGIAQARAPIIVTLDGDLQNDPADIPMMVDKLEEGYDLVNGWRKNRQDGLWLRKIPSWCANRLISKFCNLRLHDYGCTLKVYRAKDIRRIRLYGEMHRFIPAMVSREGGKVAEVPVRHHARTEGESKYGLERIFKVLLDLFLLAFMSGYAARPIHFFGFFGFASMSLGGVIGAIVLYLRYVTGQEGINLVPLTLLTMLLVLLGGQTILIGLLAEIGIRTYYEAQGRPPYIIETILNGDA